MWDPYYGDRDTHLAFIGVDLDPTRLHQILNACLLTDLELAGGESYWRTLDDPFAGCFRTRGLKARCAPYAVTP